MTDQLNVPDIFHFEKKMHKVVYETQRHTSELCKLEKEQLLLRAELYSKELLLQTERKLSHDLRLRLNLAMENMNRLEEEKMRDKMDYSNLSINYDNASKERDFLAKEASSSQTEATKFKIKVESLENTLKREKRRREELENVLSELKTDHEKVSANIDMNIAKLSKEQKYLLERSKAAIQLNKRLQTFGLCFHAINEKNKTDIRNLKRELIALSFKNSNNITNDKLHPELENLCFKIKEKLDELNFKMQDSLLTDENTRKVFEGVLENCNNN